MLSEMLRKYAPMEHLVVIKIIVMAEIRIFLYIQLQIRIFLYDYWLVFKLFILYFNLKM